MADQYLQNRYRLEKVLGQGGMGRVYLAFDTEKNRKVAVKHILVPEYVENKARLLERFKREHLFLSSIDHPNIIKAFDLFEEKGNMFLVLEFIEGISLKEFIHTKAKNLYLIEKLAIATQITRSIEILHAAGIIHRDIKPDNIMVDEKSHFIKLLDLGIAKSTDKNLEKLTDTQAQVGTPSYMSPEQVNGEATKSSDIFSLGTVLYQLFLGLPRSPFQENDALRTMLNICEKKLPSLMNEIGGSINNIDKHIYSQLSELIDQTLEKDVNQRLSEIAIIAERLSTLYQELKTKEKGERNVWQMTRPLDIGELQKLTNLVKQSQKKKISGQPEPQFQKKQNKKGKYIFGTMIFIVMLIYFVVYSEFPDNDDGKTRTFSEQDISVYMKKGHIYFHQKKYEKAEKQYNKAIALNPKYFYAYANRGVLYFHQKKYKKAEKDYSKSIALNPQHSYAYANRGVLYYDQKKYKEAEKDLNKAIVLDPKYFKTYANRGLLYYDQGKREEALKNYNKAIALNPQYFEVYAHRGLLYESQRKYKKAEKDYNKAITLNSQYSYAYANRGILYYNQRKYKEAEKDYNKAIVLNPKYFYAYANRAVLYYGQRKYKEAEKDYNKAIALNPQYSNAYANRGVIYAEQGKYGQALRDWEKAISLGYSRQKLLPMINKAKKLLNKQ